MCFCQLTSSLQAASLVFDTWKGNQKERKLKESRALRANLAASSSGDDRRFYGFMTAVPCQCCFCDQIGAEQLLSSLLLRFVSQCTVVGEEMSSDLWV